MIEPIPNLPDNVLGFSASGTVTSADYESVIVPTVDALFARVEGVRLLYHLGPSFTGFEAAAMWDDTKIGLKHWSGWERIAVVSDVEWIRAGVKLFSLAMPGRIRVFANDALEEAKRWVSE
jgi:hypothetical protein